MLRRRRRPPRSLVLYTSAACGLCEHARAALGELGLPYAEVEVQDRHPYRLRTPVLEAGGMVVAEGDIAADTLRTALGLRP